ncbi:D-aminoacyl-tRNA deacylase [Mobilicoccus caccae]|uniref:D-aminoacyl-tRNA deacylase n=1 Tax=Mobilicoccus caccae TaxID=1859295 RepID=A0ABQ6ISV5_9MICO|nr:D-aminoacyl-tRNA deacylase [Mobilicoccus caccae]GMA40992.1 D-aminoacyl-tRNA deacylase [Mobilicoccus caccae]
MRAVLQRVDGARVVVAGEEIGAVEGPGLLALVAATHTDGPDEVATMVRKIAELRILAEEKSVEDVGGGVLVVSQFTLYGRTVKGRRPSWSDAAPGSVAEPLVDAVAEGLRERGVRVATGRFGADMRVELCNDGPFTVIVDV